MDYLNRSVHINKWLLPVSWLYGLIVYFRNKLFDWKIFSQKQFPIPVICIGNITVGGTGKTPHTEYLVELLKNQYKVAVLSRGYGRKTKGFILATANSTSCIIGDEPFQIKQKYSDIIVAVDENRCRGIRYLLDSGTPPDVILLDDAFQHRYVKPSFTILLTDFNRPMNQDALLPAGRLRESVSHAAKANIIVMTKCPDTLSPIDFRLLTYDIKPYPYQSLFFTKFTYKKLVPIFGDKENSLDLNFLKDKHILVVTGIASPSVMIEKLKKYTGKIYEITYPDHHSFSEKDIEHIKTEFDKIQSDNKIIITTEKDATRLILMDNIDDSLKQSIFYLPIRVLFRENGQQIFNDKILEHVRENTTNNSFHKKQGK